MARNSVCYGAKDALERDLHSSGMVPYSPVVLTSDQEDALMNRKVWNSGYKLWKLKSSQPHLFANIERMRGFGGSATGDPTVGGQAPQGVPGFDHVAAGWLFHSDRQVYMEEASRRCLWYDSTAGIYRELAAGEDLVGELALTGAATTSSSSRVVAPNKASTLPAASPSSSSSPTTSARHLVIIDLHKAADMFKFDLTHIDRPAAMLAVYKHAEGAALPETAAKCLHEKILRRLAAFRGLWSEEALQAALVDAMSGAAVELKAPVAIAGAVALLLGSRLIAAANHGAACAIADALPENMKDIRSAVASSPGAEISATCLRLESRSAACILLYTESIDEQAARQAAGHAERGRPRAGAVALLQQAASASSTSADAPAVSLPACSRAAACAHLAWAGAEEVEGGTGGPASKRARTSELKGKDGRGKETKVRCRQVLVRYYGCRQTADSLRRKPARRSQAEAEAAVLGVLNALEEARAAGGISAAEAAFTKNVRAVSECTSSLKGGDLAGDIGWLRLPEIKPGEKVTRETAQRMLVIRAALGLAVNEVSDIVVSDDGVHLLKRAA